MMNLNIVFHVKHLHIVFLSRQGTILKKIIGLFHVKLCAQILIARRGYSIIFL